MFPRTLIQGVRARNVLAALFCGGAALSAASGAKAMSRESVRAAEAAGLQDTAPPREAAPSRPAGITDERIDVSRFADGAETAQRVSGGYPIWVTFQGYLADDQGVPVDSLIALMDTYIYDAFSGSAPLWQSGFINVPVENGVFSLPLGAIAFPDDLFDDGQTLWLALSIDGAPEMTPRTRLTGSAFANWSARAGCADSLAAGAGVTSLNGLVDGVMLAAGTNVSITPSGNTLTIDATPGAADSLGTGVAVTSLNNLTDQVTLAAGGNMTITASADTLTLDADAAGWTHTGLHTVRTGNGSVLINTTTATTSNPLHVAGDVVFGGGITNFDNTTEHVMINGQSGPWFMGVHNQATIADTDFFISRTSNGDEFHIEQNGDVGIGTDVPQAGFHFQDADISLPASALHFERQILEASDAVLGMYSTEAGNAGSTISLGEITGGALVDKWAIARESSGSNSGLRFTYGTDPDYFVNPTRFYISPAGHVGVGTRTPDVALHVTGGGDAKPGSGGYLVTGSVTGKNLVMDDNEIMGRDNGSTSGLFLQIDGGPLCVGTVSEAHDINLAGEMEIDVGAGSGSLLFVDNGLDPVFRPSSNLIGEIGSSAYPFWRTYSSQFYASSLTSYLAYSDLSLKEDIRPIRGALDTVRRLRGVRYAFKADHYYRSERGTEEERTRQLGLIAQEVEGVLPEIVREDEQTGLKMVGYMGLIPVLLEAVKEQQGIIDRLEARVAALEGGR